MSHSDSERYTGLFSAHSFYLLLRIAQRGSLGYKAWNFKLNSSGQENKIPQKELSQWIKRDNQS